MRWQQVVKWRRAVPPSCTVPTLLVEHGISPNTTNEPRFRLSAWECQDIITINYLSHLVRFKKAKTCKIVLCCCLFQSLAVESVAPVLCDLAFIDEQRASLLRASSWHLKAQIADWKECPRSDDVQDSVRGRRPAMLSNEGRVVQGDEEQRIPMCCELGHLRGCKGRSLTPP